MTDFAKRRDTLHALYVDMGTTNTRLWLMCGDRMLASASELIGIRDAAKNGNAAIRKGLRELIAKAHHEAQRNGEACTPQYIVASGMIGSNLGLAEVPHIKSPAGIEELTAAARWYHFSNVSDVPVLLIPGVRCGPSHVTAEAVNEVDVMRGEETLCAGLVALGLVKPPGTVLNLGSHWKAIQLDHDGRIESSVTSLSGELLHAVQRYTVLVGSVASERPERLSAQWIEAGMKEQRTSGLARALFCIRLLDLAHQGNAEDRLAFAVGAFIAADLDALIARGVIAPRSTVALVGHSAVSEAWRTALCQKKIAATIITQEQAETALLEAMRHILAGALPALESSPERARE
jgi:2-dehydro-3-deoxygalactonokinase